MVTPLGVTGAWGFWFVGVRHSELAPDHVDIDAEVARWLLPRDRGEDGRPAQEDR